MRALVQRASRARVTVDGAEVGRLDAPGLVVLVGVTHTDGPAQARQLARKVHELRILPGERSAAQTGAPLLVVSQFTLFADTRRGRRPGFTDAALPEQAIPLYERFASELEQAGVRVARGRFGAEMAVELVNDGPVTLLLEV